MKNLWQRFMQVVWEARHDIRKPAESSDEKVRKFFDRKRARAV